MCNPRCIPATEQPTFNVPVTYRDLDYGHQDFQRYIQKPAFRQQPVFSPVPVTGIVASTLPPSGKPVCVYDPPADPRLAFLSNCSGFNDWFNDVPSSNTSVGCFSAEATNALAQVGEICRSGNVRIDDSLLLRRNSRGNFEFTTNNYFPLNGRGFNDKIARSFWATTNRDPQFFENNYLFTSEISVNFTYQGGEVFTFQGDDDVWVYINNQLAVDLGGVHPNLESSVNLDEFASIHGLQIGNTYPLHLFHAERQVTASTFRIETSLCIVDECPERCPGFERSDPFFDFGGLA